MFIFLPFPLRPYPLFRGDYFCATPVSTFLPRITGFSNPHRSAGYVSIAILTSMFYCSVTEGDRIALLVCSAFSFCAIEPPSNQAQVSSARQTANTPMSPTFSSKQHPKAAMMP